MNDMDQNAREDFTSEEMLTLHSLRTRYQEDCDRFSDGERARLRFLHWLYESEHRHTQVDSNADEDGAGAHGQTGAS